MCYQCVPSLPPHNSLWSESTLVSFPGPHAEVGLVTHGKIPICAELSSLDFRVGESRSSIANYCIVITFFTP